VRKARCVVTSNEPTTCWSGGTGRRTGLKRPCKPSPQGNNPYQHRRAVGQRRISRFTPIEPQKCHSANSAQSSVLVLITDCYRNSEPLAQCAGRAV
jgi:hypothetical protein